MTTNPRQRSEYEDRARQLYDEGGRILAAQYDDALALIQQETPPGPRHSIRASVAYAGVLLRAGGAPDVVRAAGILRAVAAMQETREQDAHYGNFRWYFEDECVTDLNAVEFVLDGLNALLRDHERALPDDVCGLVRRMIALGLEEIDRLDVHPSYTNIALSDIGNSVLGGESIGDAAYIERAARRLDEWLEFTNRSGAPHEFNSPTYAAVDIARLAALAEGTRDPAIALKARVAEERLWLHAASHYHPELAQLGGPHARSYRDGWTGAPGYLKLMLWKLLGDDNLRRPTPWFASREEGHTGIALARYHCPDYALDWFREKRYPFEAVETADAPGGVDIATFMARDYVLGTASRSYAVGDPPEPSMQFNSLLLHFRRDAAPGFGTLFCRYMIDDQAPGSAVGDPEHEPHDFWDQGRHCGAQHRNRAIIAYGLRPRARPVHSYKLSVRMLGAGEHSEIYAGERRVERLPARIEPGEPVVIAEGGVFIAIVPLEPSDLGSDAPIELGMTDGMLALDMYNYRGPAKTFWEYASLGGAFYKGNVRNAFVLEVAGRDDFAGVDAFREHIAAASIADSLDEEFVREIAYASDGGSVALRYDLWDMSLVERRYDGAVYAPPMGRAGSSDGAGPQWGQSRDSIVELGGVKLLAGRAPAWLFADADRGRYVFANPSHDVVPLWLETPRTVIECDAFGFGRMDWDEREALLRVETVDRPGALRVRTEDDLRLHLNGADVTDSMIGPDDAGVREWTG